MEGKKLETSHRIASVSDQSDHDFGTAIRIYKSDIKKIGHTTFTDDTGKTGFVCNPKTSNIEEILLREILSLYGYKIEHVGEIELFDNDILIVTDMPWSEYMELKF